MNPILSDFFQYRNAIGFQSKYFDVMNVRYLVTDANSDKRVDTIRPTLKRVASIDNMNVYERVYNYPRFYFVDKFESNKFEDASNYINPEFPLNYT